MDAMDNRLRVAGVSEAAGIGEWSEVVESYTDVAVFCGGPTDMSTFRARHSTCVIPADSPPHAILPMPSGIVSRACCDFMHRSHA